MIEIFYLERSGNHVTALGGEEFDVPLGDSRAEWDVFASSVILENSLARELGLTEIA